MRKTFTKIINKTSNFKILPKARLAFYFFFILLYFLTVAPSSSWAFQKATYWNGEAQLDWLGKIKPTGKTGYNDFDIHHIRIGPDYYFEQGSHFILQFNAGSLRDSNSGLPSSYLEQAYFNFENTEPGNYFSDIEVNYGLIPNPWLNLIEEEYWDYTNLGMNGPSLMERYSYISTSDIGLHLSKSYDNFDFHFSIVNGEGLNSSEKGFKKDTQFLIHFVDLFSGNMNLMLTYIYGGYEQLLTDNSKKERFALFMQFPIGSSLKLNIEGLLANDPVDAINEKIADQVSLTNYGGQMARAEGLSFSMAWKDQEKPISSIFKPTWEYFLKVDRLNPYKDPDVKNKNLTSLLWGAAYQQSENVTIYFGENLTTYEENHSLSPRDQDYIFVSTKIKFL